MGGRSPTTNKLEYSDDGPFGRTINIKYDQKQKHNNPCFPDGHLCCTIMGCSGCGKSSIMINYIMQIANLSQVIICSLITRNKVYDIMEAYCDEKDIEFKVLNDPITAQNEIENMIENKPDGTNGIVILDDFSQQKSGRSDPYNSFSSSVSALLRNCGYHSAFITQSATNIPTLFRNNANMKIVFQMNDIHAIRSIRADFVGSGVLKNNDEFDELYALIQQKQHSFLMLVCKGGRNNKLYIYLREAGEETDTFKSFIQEVIISRGDYEYREDSNLVNMIKEYQEALSKQDLYGRIQKRKIRQMIRNYIGYLAEAVNKSTSQIEDEISNTFDIDL